MLIVLRIVLVLQVLILLLFGFFILNIQNTVNELSGQLETALLTIEEEEAVIREMNIEPYKYADLIDYAPNTPRKLLLHKKEIKRLIGLISTKGLTLIATKVFEQNGYIKIQLALAKGKKDIDKRRKITDKRVRKEIRDFK